MAQVSLPMRKERNHEHHNPDAGQSYSSVCWDYYLNNDAATVAIREAYKTYLNKMFQLYGFSADEAAKKKLLPYLHETTLATFSKSRTELRILRQTTTR